MFRGMKPLPKAILIGVVVAGVIAAYQQFAPKKAAVQSTPQVEAQEVQEVQVQEVQDVQPAPAQEAPVERNNVTSGDAGLAAVLQAGKK